MRENIVAFWINLAEYYKLRFQEKETRREYIQYHPSSYKGRDTMRNMEHARRMVDNRMEKIEAYGYKEEFKNVRNVIDKFVYHEGLDPDQVHLLVELICQRINVKMRYGFPIFHSQRQAQMFTQPIQPPNELTITYNDRDYKFQLYPFECFDRRHIIDEILRDLESQ